ncbi:MAG: helix-turn-helix domain-containing protein [Planctomycetaceae bacterium]|jgi:Mor family transcriptional regulator|nr:helix-turn-helix domain-containing protein [Planctomycetaceae bacterium]
MKTKKKKKPVLAKLRHKKMLTRRRHVLVLYRQGFSTNKIAIKLQVNPQTVRSDLHLMGKRIRVQQTKTKRNAALIKDRFAGKTICDLAKKYKISEDRVKELIDNYNKTAENPIPDYRELRLLRLTEQQKNPKKLKRKKVPPKTTTPPEKMTPSFRAKRANFMEKRLKRMVAMRKSGSPVKTIAQQYHLSTNRVYQLLQSVEDN